MVRRKGVFSTDYAPFNIFRKSSVENSYSCVMILWNKNHNSVRAMKESVKQSNEEKGKNAISI